MNISKEGLMKFTTISSLLEYKTLMCLLANASEEGSTYIKQEDIAKTLNTTRQAVNRAISQLSKQNIFSIEKVGLRRIYHFNPDYCITDVGYKELYKKFSKYKNKSLEDTDNEQWKKH